MKNFLRFLIVAFTGLALSSCIEAESRITVEADGSGTIVQTVLIDKKSIKMMNRGNDNTQDVSNNAIIHDLPFITEKHLKDAATMMGEGVDFSDIIEHSNDTRTGYIATYAFTDINKVTLQQAPPGPNAPPAGKGGEFINFDFTIDDDGVSTLIVKSPIGSALNECKTEAASYTNDNYSSYDNPPADDYDYDYDYEDDTVEVTAEAEAATEASRKSDMEMMEQMLKGMRMSIIVEIDGYIIDTNATYLDGNDITIMDLNFEELLANEDAFESFATSGDQSMEHLKETMKTIEGMKIDMNDELFVTFE